jgi:predicted nuclease of restriction endonuclease-like (RecB) superfamily
MKRQSKRRKNLQAESQLMAKKRATPAKTSTRSGDDLIELTSAYAALLDDIKARIRHSQVKAALAVNTQLVELYWHIGVQILLRQRQEGWGANVINRLAGDLHHAFPDMRGFSPRNLGYMKAFATAYPDPAFLQQPAAKMPWFHHCLLLDRVKDPVVRNWYMQKTIEHGWSRTILEMQIESDLNARQGKAATNFQRTLPPSQSDLAEQLLKDPYSFDFLTLGEDAQERELQRGLLAHIKQFLLELGAGFAFVGENVPLTVGDDDFFLDLLFYHLKLRAYVVIDLKMRAFKPEHAGKMNFYLSAVDDLMRHPDDAASIGLILCKTKNHAVAEYALRDIAKPVGVSGFVTRLVESLPANLQGSLPTVAQLEAELAASPLASPPTGKKRTPRSKK